MLSLNRLRTNSYEIQLGTYYHWILERISKKYNYRSITKSYNTALNTYILRTNSYQIQLRKYILSLNYISKELEHRLNIRNIVLNMLDLTSSYKN